MNYESRKGTNQNNSTPFFRFVDSAFIFAQCLRHSRLGFPHNRDENRHQLVRFILQRFQLLSQTKARSFQQLQPIHAFLKFLHGPLQLVNEIWVGFRSLCFSNMCSDRGSRPQQLVTDDLSFSDSFRQLGVETDNIEREFLCPLV